MRHAETKFQNDKPTIFIPEVLQYIELLDEGQKICVQCTYVTAVTRGVRISIYSYPTTLRLR
jgi:hypothetical protein